MKENNNFASFEKGGTSILTILGIIFVVLKLIGVISWSWFFVCLPFIIELGLVVLVLLVCILVLIFVKDE